MLPERLLPYNYPSHWVLWLKLATFITLVGLLTRCSDYALPYSSVG